MNRGCKKMILIVLLLISLDVMAVEFEKKNVAIIKALGTSKAFQTKVTVDGKQVDLFYSKTQDDKPAKYAVIQNGIYDPNCTHTWVVGIDAKSASVTDVRVVEMSCSHAFPAQKPSFLGQFRGKGPAQLKTLKSDINTIAKATGSCNLTIDAVITAVKAVSSIKGGV